MKKWTYYGVALAATVLAGFLWTVVLDQLRNARSTPAAQPAAAGTLPVVVPIVPADPVRATLYEDLRTGRAVCDGGFYARQALDGSRMRIETSQGPVRCP